MTSWAVVDVETSGLNPVRDRVVEMAIVRLDSDAMPVDEWSTLINPGFGKALGRVHGLLESDVAAAPMFTEIVDDVLGRLAGHVIVAHNAPFDIGFIQAETLRAGVAWGPVEGFCTMTTLKELGVAKSRKLHVCCAELGVKAGPEHIAIEDARAVAGLMGYLAPRLWTIETPAPAPPWTGPSVTTVVRQRAPVASIESPGTDHLARHVHVPPDLGISEAAGSTYLGLLDIVVEDGQVTDNEIDALGLFAKSCGISRDMARRLNMSYLEEMTRLAKADGVVTDQEREDLVNLMALLGRALPR